MTAAPASDGIGAIVLAGSRPSGDPVARHAGVSHKALVPVGGTAMVERVVGALIASGLVARIAVVIETPGVLNDLPGIARSMDAGTIIAVESEATPSLSALKAVNALDRQYPILLTTADHALLTPEMVGAMVDQAGAADADVVAGLAREDTIRAAYPDTVRTYLRFRDGGFSGCNLFYLATPRAERALAFWRRVEESRKSPWRIAGAVGFTTVLRYLTGTLTLKQGLARLSAAAGATGAAAILPMAEAAIDVDKPADLALVEKILAS